jgi:xylulokinase
MIEVTGSFDPDPENKAAYDRNYSVFRRLYDSNKKNFAALNER